MLCDNPLCILYKYSLLVIATHNIYSIHACNITKTIIRLKTVRDIRCSITTGFIVGAYILKV